MYRLKTQKILKGFQFHKSPSLGGIRSLTLNSFSAGAGGITVSD